MSLIDLIPAGSPIPFVELSKYWQCEEQTLLHLGSIEKIRFSVAVNECYLQQISETQREEIFREGIGSFGEHIIDFCLTGFANLLPESIFSILADGGTSPLILEHGGMLYVRILYEETKIKRITSADLFVSREQMADIQKLINIENINDFTPLMKMAVQIFNKFWKNLDKDQPRPTSKEIISWILNQEKTDSEGNKISKNEAVRIDNLIRPRDKKRGGNLPYKAKG
jgi:hypothetical protein